MVGRQRRWDFDWVGTCRVYSSGLWIEVDILPSRESVAPSVHSGNELVWHLCAVFLPLDAVLVSASAVIALHSVVEEEEHEEEVGPGEDVLEAAGGAHGP